MLLSIALIILSGYSLGKIFEKLRLPDLVGMLVAGILLGPAVLDIISPDLLNIAPDIRETALIIILARAGLSLDFNDLKRVGRPAVLMCFVPALFEIGAVVIFAPLILGISLLEAAVMGCILAPVSAAVVVPRMLKLMEEGYGGNKKIPQIIIAGTSVDDVLIIVLYLSFVDLYFSGGISALAFIKIPVSLAAGALIGILSGFLLYYIFKHTRITTAAKILIILSVSFLLAAFENAFPRVPVSALLSVMVMGAVLFKKSPETAGQLSKGLTHLWEGAQIMLFALVGCAVRFEYINNAGWFILAVLLSGTLLRFIGVWIALIKTGLSFKEKLFCGIAYLPKATVQAAMGALPLSMGMPSGEIILAIAVLAILILAPAGAFLIDLTYKKLLSAKTL